MKILFTRSGVPENFRGKFIFQNNVPKQKDIFDEIAEKSYEIKILVRAIRSLEKAIKRAKKRKTPPTDQIEAGEKLIAEITAGIESKKGLKEHLDDLSIQKINKQITQVELIELGLGLGSSIVKPDGVSLEIGKATDSDGDYLGDGRELGTVDIVGRKSTEVNIKGKNTGFIAQGEGRVGATVKKDGGASGRVGAKGSLRKKVGGGDIFRAVGAEGGILLAGENKHDQSQATAHAEIFTDLNLGNDDAAGRISLGRASGRTETFDPDDSGERFDRKNVRSDGTYLKFKGEKKISDKFSFSGRGGINLRKDIETGKERSFDNPITGASVEALADEVGVSVSELGNLGTISNRDVEREQSDGTLVTVKEYLFQPNPELKEYKIKKNRLRPELGAKVTYKAGPDVEISAGVDLSRDGVDKRTSLNPNIGLNVKLKDLSDPLRSKKIGKAGKASEDLEGF